MFSLLELLPEPPPAIHIVDVGALSCGEEHEAYGPLLGRVPVKIVGFEPVTAELERLSAAKLLKLAVILHESFGSYDFCALVLRHRDAAAGGRLAEAYLERLTGGARL